MLRKKSVVRAVALLAMAVLLSACSALPGGDVSTGGSSQPLPPPISSEGERLAFPEVADSLAQAKKDNPDTVGWLYIPGTTINEPVMQAKDNDYYLRRNAKKGYSYAGSLFLDFRADVQKLSQNSVIYGHNLGAPWGRKDDPDGEKFAQLLKFTDPDFARRNPNLYLAMGDGKYVFEIFGVFYSEAYSKPVEYHHEKYSKENFALLMKDIRARSLYQYEGEVGADDRILTLSTCTYQYGTYSQNPNQRFVVTGRLLREGESPRETAGFTVNEAPKPPAFAA